jgi:hypothetical protein
MMAGRRDCWHSPVCETEDKNAEFTTDRTWPFSRVPAAPFPQFLFRQFIGHAVGRARLTLPGAPSFSAGCSPRVAARIALISVADPRGEGGGSTRRYIEPCLLSEDGFAP